MDRGGGLCSTLRSIAQLVPTPVLLDAPTLARVKPLGSGCHSLIPAAGANRDIPFCVDVTGPYHLFFRRSFSMRSVGS